MENKLKAAVAMAPISGRRVLTSLWVLLLLLCATVVQATPNAEKATQVSQQLVQAFNQADMDAIGALIDQHALADNVANQLFDRQNDVRDFVRGFTSEAGRKQLIEGMFGALIKNGAKARFMRLVHEPHVRPLVRIDIFSGGNEYLLLDIADNGLIADFYTASSGRQASDSVADASRLMVKPSANALRKLFGNVEIDNAVLDVFADVAKLRIGGQFAEAYTRLNALPDDIKSQKVVINTAVQLAQHIDERHYSIELARLAKHFGDDPSMQFMLIDYYYFTEQTEAGLNAISRLMARFGEDAVLNNLKASFYYSGGDVQKAIEYGNKAVSIERDFEPAYWSLAQIYNEQERFDALVDLFSSMSEHLSLQFNDQDFAAQPAFRSFRMSSEYRSWMPVTE